MGAPPDAYLEQATSALYREHWFGPPEMVERIAAAAGTRAGQRILDVGCGLGGRARRLARLSGAHVLAIDLVEPVIACARLGTADGAAAPGSVRFAGSAGERFPFTHCSFDQVWCLGTLAYLSDPLAFAREAGRVLRPGGRAVVTEAFWEGRVRPRFSGFTPSPWRAVRLASLLGAMHAVGFADLRVLPWPGAKPVVHDPAMRADLADARLVTRLVLGRIP